MTPETIQQHVAEAKEALRSFLGTIIDDATPLEVDEPAESTFDEMADALAAHLVVYDADTGFAVALEQGWVELVSTAMLGEAMGAGDPGAEDLVSEIAAQGYGTVRTALAGEGLRLPEAAMNVSLPGDRDVALEGSLWQAAFRMDAASAGDPLGGFALFPAVEADAPAAAPPSASPAAKPAGGNPRAAAGTPGSASGDRAGGAPPSPPSGEPVEVSAASFSDLGAENLRGSSGDGASGNFDLLAEVELEITVELGRRHLPLADVLRLTPGSVIELEKLVGEPLEIYANGRLIAEGEAVVIDEQFGIRITSLASKNQREKAFF